MYAAICTAFLLLNASIATALLHLNISSAQQNFLPSAFKCRLPGTKTLLLITPEEHKISAWLIYQLLTQIQKSIRRWLQQHGNRRLLGSELLFTVYEWDLRFQAYALPANPETSTWALLDDVIECLFRCAYNDVICDKMQALIMSGTEPDEHYRGHLISKDMKEKDPTKIETVDTKFSSIQAMWSTETEGNTNH